MAKIARQLTELIGHTPLLELTNYEKALGLEAKIKLSPLSRTF